MAEFVAPPRMRGETDQAYRQRIITAMQQHRAANPLPWYAWGATSPEAFADSELRAQAARTAQGQQMPSGQYGNESNLSFGLRRVLSPFVGVGNAAQLTNPLALVGGAGEQVVGAARYALDTPNAALARANAAPAPAGRRPDYRTAAREIFGGAGARGTRGTPNPFVNPNYGMDFTGWAVIGTPGDPRNRRGPDGRRYQVPHGEGRPAWDFRPPEGRPEVRFARPARVISTGTSRLGGNYARVDFGNGQTYTMLHLANRPEVREYAPGEVVALAGRTGNASGFAFPQVHIQPYGNNNTDPRQFFQGAGSGQGGGAQVAGQQLPANFVNPFDPTYGNMAIGELNAAEQQALRPQLMQFDRPPAPEMPEPTPVPRTDFTRADAALEAMRPVEMTEREKLRIRRQGYFRGLGQALMAMPEGAGLGRVLAMAGGGALAGVGAANDDIQQRMDRFEQRMAQYNAAVYSHETGRAQIMAREAQMEAQQLNQHALQRWQTAYQQWANDNQVQVTENAIVTRRQGPGGQLLISRVPYEGAVRAGFAQARAQIYAQMGGQLNSANGQVTGAANSLIAALAGQYYLEQQQGGDPLEGGQALVGSAALMSSYAVQYGRVADVVGAATYDRMRRDVNASMTRDGFAEPNPGEQSPYMNRYMEMFNQRLAELLLRGALQDPGMARRLFEAGGGGMALDRAEQIRDTRTRRTTDYRGRTTTSTTTGGAD